MYFQSFAKRNSYSTKCNDDLLFENEMIRSNHC